MLAVSDPRNRRLIRKEDMIRIHHWDVCWYGDDRGWVRRHHYSLLEEPTEPPTPPATPRALLPPLVRKRTSTRILPSTSSRIPSWLSFRNPTPTGTACPISMSFLGQIKSRRSAGS
ncbi:hypothetical protein F5X99DRAFT_382343 [Biscogniauxia marginata]|nr:hypothetical protein F5X99DRAFT_382343 [Biscogniauxia marginata]